MRLRSRNWLLWAVLLSSGAAGAAHAQSTAQSLYRDDPLFSEGSQNAPIEKFTLIYDGQPLGTADAVVHLGKTYLSLSEVARALKLSYSLDSNAKRISLSDADQHQLLEMNLGRQTFFSQGEQSDWFDNELIETPHDMYVATSLLNRMLHLEATANQAQLRITLRALPQASAQAVAVPAALPAEPTAQAAPVAIVSSEMSAPIPRTRSLGDALQAAFAHGSAQVPAAPSVLPPAAAPEVPAAQAAPLAEPKQEAPPQPVASTPDAAAPTQATAEPTSPPDNQESQPEEAIAAGQFDEAEPVVLQPTIAGGMEGDEFFEALKLNDIIYVDFGSLMRFLEFYIQVADDGQTADGWFLSSGNKFSLDRDTQHVEVGDKSYDLPANSTHWQDDILYVDIRQIEQWMPLKLTFLSNYMQLRIDTDEQLPFQQRALRQKQWLHLKNMRRAEAKQLEPVESPPGAWDTPFVDVILDNRYNSANQRKFLGSYTLQSVGDVGYHSLRTYVSGNSQSGIDTARITAERKNVDGNLLGPLGATEYYVGDVNSGNLPLIAQTSLGRGVALSNRSIDYVPEADVKTFVGDAPAGWEVEIYRNGILLDYQTVGADGRYNFEDVPVLFGRNNFKIVLYGLQGQLEEREESINIGTTMLTPGKVQYSFSADDKGHDVTGLSRAASQGYGARMTGSMDVGVTNWLTLGGFSSYLPLFNGEDHFYTGASADMALLGMLLSSDVAYDQTDKTYAARATLLGETANVNWRVAHEYNDGMISEVERNANNIRESYSVLDMNTQLFLPLIQDVNVNWVSDYSQFATTPDQYSSRLRMGKNFLGLNTTHIFNYQYNIVDRLDYSLGIQGRYDKVFWRLLATQHLKPVSTLNNVNAMMQYRLTDDIIGRTSVQRDFAQTGLTSVNQTLSWQLEKTRLSVFGQANNQSQYAFGVSIGFSMGWMPDGGMHWQASNMLSGGGVLGDVYLDENYNGMHDEDEPLIDEAALKINGRSTKHQTNRKLSVPVEPYKKVEVSVDEGSIKHPLWRPSMEGYEVQISPGQMRRFNFPVVATSEIDGTVWVKPIIPEEPMLEGTDMEAVIEYDALIEERENLEPTGLSHVIVQLVNKDGRVVDDVMSEMDGFFHFAKVLPGDYVLKVAPDVLNEMHMQEVQTPSINVVRDSDFYMEQDILLLPAEESEEIAQEAINAVNGQILN